MDRVATGVAQEIGVFFKNDDVDAGAGQQQAGTSCWPARHR